MNHVLLVVEDDDVMRITLSEVFTRKGFKVIPAAKGGEAVDIVRSQKVDLVLLDLRLPDANGLDIMTSLRSIDDDITVIVMTAYPEVKTAISAMKAGAYDYINKPFELEELKLLVDKALEARTLKSEVELFRIEKKNECMTEMVGSSLPFKQVKELITTIAGTPRTSVLILGETGTGKELVAHAIHCGSERSERPYIKINCSAIPENLLESELFGYEKGAFTDAKQSKKGLFDLADGGTIFLDEIGDMDARLQPKLLQVLENQTFRKVGGTRDIRVDIRVIAATNRDLEGMVRERRFREDLYYRLKVMFITLPPLRERMEDVTTIAEHFLHVDNRALGKDVKGFSQESRNILTKYRWPGNIRELRNVIERAVILAKSGGMVLPEHLSLEAPRMPGVSAGTAQTLEDIEKEHILLIIQKLGGNKSRAAEYLGISRLTLREKLKRYGIQS